MNATGGINESYKEIYIMAKRGFSLSFKNFVCPNPEISRVRGVHLQGIQGRSRSRLLQVLDNAANERLGHARRVKIFEKLNLKIFGTNCHLIHRSKIVNNQMLSLLTKRPLENFHEIFGLTRSRRSKEYSRMLFLNLYLRADLSISR